MALMARWVALPGALLLLGQVCGCEAPAGGVDDGGTDQPDVASPRPDGGISIDDDAGTGDAGTGDAGTGDAGADGGSTLTGTALVQREDGVLVELDLETGDVSYPLGERMVQGGIASVGDQLLTFSWSALEGRLYGWNPVTGAFTPYARANSSPYSLATSPDGTRVATLGSLGDAIYEGALTDEELGQTGANPVGTAVTYTDAGELVYATEQGVRFAADGPDLVFFDYDCAALSHLSEEEGYLCGAVNGGQLLRFDETGTLEVLDETPGAPYRSVTRLTDGTTLAVRFDGTLVGDAERPDGLEALHPAQIVELGDSLYIGQGYGGLLEYDGTTLYQRLGFARFAGGLTTGGDRLAIGGGPRGDLGTFGAEFEALTRSGSLEDTLGLALADDGAVLLLTEEGLARLSPGEAEPEELSAFEDGTSLARQGDFVVVARGALGLFRAPLSAPDSLTALDTAPADLVAGCDASVVYLGGDELRAFDDVAGDRVLLSSLVDVVGEVTGVGCVNNQVLLGTADGQVWGRPVASSAPLQQAGQLDLPVWYFTTPLE